MLSAAISPWHPTPIRNLSSPSLPGAWVMREDSTTFDMYETAYGRCIIIGIAGPTRQPLVFVSRN